MKAKKRQLILSLIKDDLINTKLVYSLNAIGLHAEDYLLDLSDTIFKLMGFKDTLETETVYKYYLELTKKAKHINISKSRKRFDKLAYKIYNELLNRKSIC